MIRTISGLPAVDEMAVLISDSTLTHDTAKNAQHPTGNSLVEKELL